MKNKLLLLSTLAIAVFISSCKDEEIEKPVASVNPTAQTISSGSATAIALTSSIDGTTFTWTVEQNGVSGATPGTGNSIAQTLTTIDFSNGSAVYTITPTANGVAGEPVTVTITVTPPKVTYNAHVKPLVTSSCTPCHMASGYNPVKLDQYAVAKSKINNIIDRVKREQNAAGFMPSGGTKLSADKIALLEKWRDDGLLEN